MTNPIFQQAKEASKKLLSLSDSRRYEVLFEVADAIIYNKVELLEANARDLARMQPDNPLYDRLQLNEARLEGIAADMRHVAKLSSPLGRTLLERTLDNGLSLRRVSVPFGVIGVIYEARPNVSFDVFALCFKSGNACILKGGSDAENSNRAIVQLIQRVLQKMGVNEHVVQLLPATHEATAQLLGAVGYVDLCIPRGGKRLIEFVRDNARVPVIETGAGVVNTYFDVDGNIEMGRAIIANAKTAELCEPLAEKHVVIYADDEAYNTLHHIYPYLEHATEDSFGTEFMDYKMAIKTVGSLDEALVHIARYGSGHSECIITRNRATAMQFQEQVDAACVYWNAPTSFTDGAQFGMGAEIGISTQKLGPRGPMALEELTTYKWLIEGKGQIRE